MYGRETREGYESYTVALGCGEEFAVHDVAAIRGLLRGGSAFSCTLGGVLYKGVGSDCDGIGTRRGAWIA